MKFRNIYYGWVITFVSASILAVVMALTVQTFGMYLKPLTEQFGWDRGALSGAFSIAFLLSGFLGILSGRLSDKYGPRILVALGGLLVGTGLLLMSRINSLWQVYLIWGLFMGVGTSCCFVPVQATIPRWFVKRRGMVIGIAAAFSGLVGVIWPPIVQWLISSYGWRQSFILLGLIAFALIIPLAQFMKHSPERAGVKAYGEGGTVIEGQSSASAGGLSLGRVIRVGRFWYFGLMQFAFLFCAQVILVHIVPYAVDSGFSAVAAAGILSVIAGGSAFGGLAMGFISDRIGGRLALSACFIVVTLALVWLLFAKEIWAFYLFAVVFGVASGGTGPLATVITAELFGLQFLGVVLGSVMLFGTVGGALGTPLAGSIFDITGDYQLAFLICIILCALSIIASVVLLRYKAKGSGI